jgi:outer membrane protein assembly factor BamB
VNFPRRILIVCLTTTLVAGCSIFGDKDEELPPQKLEAFEHTQKLKKVWSTKLGSGSETLHLALSPQSDGNNVYAASRDGVVAAFNPANGKKIWEVELDMQLSAGPGVGEGLVVVAAGDGVVFALSSADGSALWNADVSGESLASPLVTDNGVAVYTIDGRFRMLNLFDGEERWFMQQDLPALTLRGSSTPIEVSGTVMVGFDNGRLVALDSGNGNTEWEAMISPPTGRSDLERLADIDGKMQVVGQDVYVAGYNGRVLAMATESGQVLWQREMSSHVGLGADWNNVYVANDVGELITLLRRNGTDVWRSDALIRRDPTAPVSFEQMVAVGDFEGYVHFFDVEDGRPVTRIRVGKGPISDVPVVIGKQLYIQSETGDLAVYELPAPKVPKNQPDPEPEEQT